MRRLYELFLQNAFEEKDRIIIFAPVLFAIGVGFYFLLPFEISFWLTLILAESLLVFAYIFRYNRARLLIIGVFGVIVLGFADIQLKSESLRPPKDLLYSSDEIYLKGKVTEIDANYKGKTRIVLTDVLDFQDNHISGTYRITLNHNYNKLTIGKCVEVVARTFPLMKPNIVGGYQFDRKAYFEGINTLGYSLADAYETDCDEEYNGIGLKIKDGIQRLRRLILDQVNNSLNPEQAAITAAIVAGERSQISSGLRRQYQDSGLAHFLAISGLHMGMIVFISFFFIRFFIALIPRIALKYDSKKIAAVITVCLSFVYLLISGMQIPALRAFIMTTVILLGILFNREAVSLRVVSLAALVVLVVSPQSLISASFQMSFAAVLVLTAFYERYAASIGKFLVKTSLLRKLIAYMLGILITDAVATFATLPFSIYHFHRIAIYTLLGNFLAAPIIGFIVMPFVFITLIFMPFGIEEYPLKIVGFGISVINDITAYVSALPSAGFKVVSLPLWGLLMIIFGGIWLCVWEKPWRRWGIPAIVCGFMSILSVQIPDFITNSSANIFAIKDNEGELVILPTKGDEFVRNLWLETFAQDGISLKKKKIAEEVYLRPKSAKNEEKELLKLECGKQYCTYDNLIKLKKSGGVIVEGKEVNTEENLGFFAYISKKGVKIKTVRDDIGYRYWNK